MHGHVNVKLPVFYVKTSMYLSSYPSQQFKEWEMCQTKLWRKSKHNLHSVIIFPENRSFYEIMCKNEVEQRMSQMTI